MAVIGKIRERAGLLIGLIGVSLAAFILGDFLTTNRTSLFGPENKLAIIGDETITINEFQSQIDQMSENYKINNNVESVDQATMDQLQEQAWTQLVSDMVYGKQFEEAGVSVSQDELFDMVQGKNPHPQIKQAFTNPQTGEFNTSTVIQFLKNLDQDATGKTKMQWIAFEKFIKEERLKQKYNNLLKKGIYMPAALVKQDYEAKNKMASINFLLVNYTTITDSQAVVTEGDLKKYYEANKNRYKQETSRKVEFVIFDVLPSADDRGEAQAFINDQIEAFRVTENDSAFLSRYSDTGMDFQTYTRATAPLQIDSNLFNLETGTVVGPYFENNQFKLAKVIGYTQRPDSVEARHILFSLPSPDKADSVKAVAESTRQEIKKGKSFAELAKTLSQDPGSGQKGGDLGYFAEGTMVKPFNDAAFEGKKGDMVIVETQFGIHLIEIMNQTKPERRIQLGILAKNLTPGNQTYQAMFAEANEFAGTNSTPVLFDKAIAEKGLNKRVADNIRPTDRTIAGIDAAREVVRWVYTAKVGEVSKAFELTDKYVVAHLVEVKEKGIAPLEIVKEAVEVEVRKQVKANMIMDRIAKTGKASDLNQLSVAMNTPVQEAQNVVLSSSTIAGAGREPFVVGYAFGIKSGQTSPALKGENGVYVVKVNMFTEPPPKTEFAADRQQLMQSKSSRAEFDSFNVLKEHANIKDNRGKFY